MLLFSWVLAVGAAALQGSANGHNLGSLATSCVWCPGLFLDLPASNLQLRDLVYIQNNTNFSNIDNA